MKTPLAFALSFTAASQILTADEALKVDGNRIDTARHTISVGPTGLPAQITIKATALELPIHVRGNLVTTEILHAIGRGEQLRSPASLIIETEGKGTLAQATEPAQVKAADSNASATATLSANNISIKLKSSWSASGQMDCTFAFAGGKADAAFLQFELIGPVDFAVAGDATDEKLRTYKSAEFGLKQGEGVIWANTGDGAPEGRPNGNPSRIYIGNGDRGFTWLFPDAGNRLDAKKTSAQLVREKSGKLLFRLFLVNSETDFGKPREISIRILTHPSATKPNNFRLKAWTADASNLDGIATVSGSKGGNALSRQQHIAATYPINLHRYLLGSHTGRSAQIKTNSNKLIRAGQRPDTDWMSLGRALLHDRGVDARGLANLSEAATVLKALESFGAFKGDGKTEFIPYWRTGLLARFGESFARSDAFALSHDDPMAHVHFSLWRRPHNHRSKTMFVIVNETDKAVREQFYILNPKLLFGQSGNRLRASEIASKWKYTSIPPESDWRKEKLTKSVLSHGGDQWPDYALLDMTDGGFVVRPSAKDGIEVYGPIYIPARSYRILYGAGR